ncbi:F-box/kelch-repeat protein [Striga hermonthica]|uniref:F-box/kelch-repeat protein n=1 Tax=Striga hermonthica TaxID=68872 RepID=A0A9N7R9N6_STRHE|nr:F-box/kelch-repeat protein [Striga hermonthica]
MKTHSKIPKFTEDHFPITSLLPGLPDDVSKLCFALIPRVHFPAMAAVSKHWRSFLKSREFITVRKLAGKVEEWLYVLTAYSEENRWEVLDRSGKKQSRVPKMPGPDKSGFGVVVLNGKLIVVAGYCSAADGSKSVSRDVYEYDACLNSWRQLAVTNVPRHNFACAVVNGAVHAVGGRGAHGESLSSAEVYDPESNRWTVIEPLRRPRWGSFACGVGGKLYMMGGRSSFSIGNSRVIDVYDPKTGTWSQMKNGCVMVTSHAVLGSKICCMEWKNERRLAIFDPEEESPWKMVSVPVTGSTSVGFHFGVLNGELLLFSLQGDACNRTLAYDPDVGPGSEWRASEIKPTGLCLCTVTIEA